MGGYTNLLISCPTTTSMLVPLPARPATYQAEVVRLSLQPLRALHRESLVSDYPQEALQEDVTQRLGQEGTASL